MEFFLFFLFFFALLLESNPWSKETANKRHRNSKRIREREREREMEKKEKVSRSLSILHEGLRAKEKQ